MSTVDERVDRPHRFMGTIRFLLICWKLNFAGAMEFRLSFFMTAGMMCINNFLWLVFWSVFFNRFPIVNGWELSDVMLMWAVGAGGFGWANVLFGNFNRVAAIVANGELDVFLSQPKPVLLNVLASRMSLTAIGDFLFGLIVYGLVGDHTIHGALLFALGLLLCGLLFLFFTMAAGSLAFFLGNAEGLAYQMFNAFIALSTYPTDIFKGMARLLLFSLIPAGFISYMPIGLLGGVQAPFLAEVLFMTAFTAAFSIWLFYKGLSRYTSGNQTTLRS